MSEPMRNLTPADLREDAVRIIDAARGLIEFCDLYGDVYADDLHEEIVLAFEYISAAAKGAAKRQQALHERASKFADSVFADLERLPVQGDLLADPPDFDSVWPEAHGLLMGPEPQTDREDQTADDHDRWLEDWNSTVKDVLPPGRDDYQPRFPTDPDEEVQW